MKQSPPIPFRRRPSLGLGQFETALAAVPERAATRISRPETDGAVADYILELGKADPAHFGISLATLDGHVYEVGDTQMPFTIQSMSKPFVFALALDTLGAGTGGERHRRRAVGRSLQLDPPQRREPPVQSDGQCRRDRLFRPDPRGQGRRRVRIYPAGARPLRRARPRRRRCRLCFRKRHRRPQPRRSAICCAPTPCSRTTSAAVLEVYFRQCAILVTARDIAVMAATLANRGINPVTGEQVMTPYAIARTLSVMTSFRHVRLRRRMDLPRRHPRQERRRRRHPGGAAGAARARQLFAETRQARQQRARHQGLRGAVVALRPRICSTAATTRATASSPTTISATARRGASGARTSRDILAAHHQDVRVIELVGTLSFSNVDYVSRQLAAKPRPQFVIFDLRRVTAMTRAGARLLAEEFRELAALPRHRDPVRHQAFVAGVENDRGNGRKA